MIALITLAAGVAVRHSLGRAAGLVPDLKWPNDLVIGQRKLAGILAEGLALNTPAQAIVLGIGINLKAAAHPPEIAGRAISIEEARGHPVDRAVLQEDVLAGLSDLYGRLRRGQVDDILREWRDAAPSAVGSRVEWDTPLGSRSGTTQGIDEDGALLVRTQDSVERIIGGELRWL